MDPNGWVQMDFWGCFYLLVTMTNDAINIHVTSFCVNMFSGIFGYICRSSMAIIYFTLRGTGILFVPKWLYLLSYNPQQCMRDCKCMRVSIFQHIVDMCYSIFFIITIIVGIKWYLLVVICTSLMPGDGNLLMCLLVISVPSLVKRFEYVFFLFSFYWFFLLMSYEFLTYSVYNSYRIFQFYFVVCLFTFLTPSFNV